MPRSKHIFLLPILLPLLLHALHFSNANQPIQAIVVLVLENRSFDHMLGWLKKDNPAGYPSFDGLTGKECNHRSTADPNSPAVCVSDDARYVDPDPGHSFEVLPWHDIPLKLGDGVFNFVVEIPKDSSVKIYEEGEVEILPAVRDQVFGSSANGGTPTMSGFVEQALTVSEDLAAAVMKGFSPQSIPVFATLAQEFAVFDRWFSSLPGPTQPNRLFVYSATSHGATSHNKWDLARGYPQKTIFDSLHDDGLDFNIYFENAPTTLFYRNMRKLKYVRKFHKYGTFLDHARDGRLASLSVIEPRYFDLNGKPANDDHPSHDVANGQRLVKEVYEALRSSPQWNESLLLITYDEHGGFYDHVATPYVGIPNPDGIMGQSNFAFDRLGVRVLTIAVSPWIKRGTVVSKPKGPAPNSEFEHSSIPATIKKMFNLTSGFLTQRDAWSGTFDGVVSQLTSPRTDCPVVLPNVPPLRKTEADENRYLSEFQSEVVELASILNGDHLSGISSPGKRKRMRVKEADQYVNHAISTFLRAGNEAISAGVDESTIIDFQSSRNTGNRAP